MSPSKTPTLVDAPHNEHYNQLVRSTSYLLFSEALEFLFSRISPESANPGGYSSLGLNEDHIVLNLAQFCNATGNRVNFSDCVPRNLAHLGNTT